MHVPAGADLEHGCAVGQAAMDHGEQHLARPSARARRRRRRCLPQVMASLRGGSSSVIRLCIRCSSEKPGGRSPGRVGELVVAPDELEGRADLHLHLARRQPLAAQVALREIGPDALDRAGQKALDLQRGRLDQRAIGVERSRVRSLVVSFWGWGFACVLLAEEPFEHVQTVGPEALVEAQPLVGAGERPGLEAAQMGAAAHLAADQPGVLQRLDVLRGRRRSDIANGVARAGRPCVRRPASSRSIGRRVGVAEGVEDGIERVCLIIQPCG